MTDKLRAALEQITELLEFMAADDDEAGRMAQHPLRVARAALAAAPQPAPETMAWAVVDEDGITSSFAVYPDDAFSQSKRMADLAEGRVVRVAIRVVEGGDDAA